MNLGPLPIMYDHPDIEYIRLGKRCWYCGGLNLPDARKYEHCGGGKFEEEPPQDILDSKSFYNLVTEGGTYEPQSPVLKEPVDYSIYRPG